MAGKRRKKSKFDILTQIIELNKFVKKGGYYSLAVIFCIFIVLPIGSYEAFGSVGKIHRGIYVSNTDLSNLTLKQAELKLKKNEPILQAPVYVNYQGKKYRYTPKFHGFKVDYKKTVQNAYQITNSGSLVEKSAKRVKSWVTPIKVNYQYEIDKNQIKHFLAGIKGSDDKACIDANVVIVDSKPRVIPGQKGFGINIKKSTNQLIERIFSANKEVKLKRESLTPDVYEEQARKILKDAAKIVSDTVVITYQNNRWTLSKDELITLYLSKKIPFGDGFKLTAGLDKDKTISLIEKKAPGILKKPVDARFEVNGLKVNIIPSQNGVAINAGESIKLIEKAAKSAKERVASLIITPSQPKLTTQKAQSMGIKERVSTFTTSYTAGQSRVTNIHLIADILQGRLVGPRQTFSFNEYVGERTAQRGFVAAHEIRNNQYFDVIGGGICQVATTLFNTILEGGYDFTEREPHSLFISRYPTGRDAAVSWGGPDLKFINDTDHYIMINTGYDATTLTISFYSTNIGRSVKFNTVFLGNIGAPVQIIKDPNLEEGKQKVEKGGASGKRYYVTREIFKDGKKIHTETFYSNYNPQPQVVIQGAKKPDSKVAKKKKKDTKAKKP